MRRNVLWGVGWEGEWVGLGMRSRKECGTGLKMELDVRGDGRGIRRDVRWNAGWDEGRLGEAGCDADGMRWDGHGDLTEKGMAAGMGCLG